MGLFPVCVAGSNRQGGVQKGTSPLASWRDNDGQEGPMPEQFKNDQEIEVAEETKPELTEQEKKDRIANRLARKPAETEKKFEEDNSNLFNK